MKKGPLERARKKLLLYSMVLLIGASCQQCANRNDSKEQQEKVEETFEKTKKLIK